jgi:hypothetical protein
MLTEIRRKREAGEPLTAQESTVSARMQALRQQPGGPPAGGMPAQAPAGDQGAGRGDVDQEQVRAAFAKLRAGQTLTPAEQALMARMRTQMGSGRRRFGAGNNFQFGGSYIVFALRDGRPMPVRIRTGITDMDYSEVVSGLTEQDTVLLLPSASLVQSQQEMRERFNRLTGGGGLPGMRQQQQTQTATPSPGGGGGPR